MKGLLSLNSAGSRSKLNSVFTRSPTFIIRCCWIHIPQHILSVSQLVSYSCRGRVCAGGRKWLWECVITFSLLCTFSRASWMSYICVSYLPDEKERRFTTRTRMTHVLCIYLFFYILTFLCVMSETITPDWTCPPKYQMSCRLHGGKVYIMFPIRQTQLWRKQTQLLLAIDTFVVPLCWTAIVCSRNPQLLTSYCACLEKTIASFFLSQRSLHLEQTGNFWSVTHGFVSLTVAQV